MSEQTGNGYISRGNMTVVLSAAGLIMIAFGSFITFQSNAADRRMQELRDDIKVVEKSYLRRDEHEEFKRGLEKDIGLIRHTQDQRGEAIVPRAEHNARWKAIDDFALLLSNRINEVRGNLSAITTPQSQFTRMENDIIELRKQQNTLIEAIARKP